MQGSILAKKALEIDKVKIYRYVQGHPSHVSKDKLEVLYLPEFDTFLLQQKNFKYVLAPNAPILATLFEKKAFRSYILTDLNGYYLVKLKTAPPPPVLKNFENILCNYSQLAYKSGQEELKKDQGKESKKKLSWTEKISKAGAALQRGGEIFRDKVVDAATAATRKNGPKENNPNHLSEKTIEELKDLDNKVNLVVEVPRNEVVQLFSLSKEIEAMTVSQIERGKRAPERKGTQGQHWQEFGKGAAGSAQSIWKGMEEAASIIYEAIKKKKSGKQGGDLSYQERPTEKTDNGDQQGPYSRSQSDYSPILPNSNNSSFQSFDLVQSLEMKGRPHSDQNKLLQDITIDLAESVIKPQSEYRPQTNHNPMPMYQSSDYIKPASQTNEAPQNSVPMYQSSDYKVPAPQANQVPQNSVPMYEPCDYIAPAPQMNQVPQNSVPMYESSDYKKPAPQANETLQDNVPMYESSDYKKPAPKNNEVADMKPESQTEAKSNVESASSASFGLTESVTEYPQAENQPQLKQNLQDAVPMYESSDFIRKVPENATQSIPAAGNDEQFTGFKRGESRDIDLAPQYKPQNDENMPPNNQQYPGFDMVESMDMKLAPKSVSQDKQQPQVQADNTGLGVIPFAESGVYVRPLDSQVNQTDSTGLGKIPFAESTIFMGPSHSAVNK